MEYAAEQADREAEDDGDSESYQAARSRKESAIANLRELEVAEKEGKLIDCEHVQAAT